jgi:SAM-dependent methyltransferase
VIEDTPPAAVVDGIPAFAPCQAHTGESFDLAAFAGLARLEEESFWFLSRNALITWAATRYFPAAQRIHEVGCGTGFVLRSLRRAYPEASISGSELLLQGLRIARERLPGVRLMQMDARAIPFREAFDLVGAFDVLEHIDEDAIVLKEVRRSLRPGGGLLLTVPQHQWLWSPQDEAARHVRRYEASDLRRMLDEAGFDVLRSTSFVSFLLPAMLLTRRTTARRAKPGVEAVRVPWLLDRVMRPIMAIERWLIRGGIDLPVGGSLLVIARRREA